jgi:hypothetical protein
MNDEALLQEIAVLGQLSPRSESERAQFSRLIAEGDLRRVPVTPMAGDTGDPLLCELTERGKQRISGRR